MRITQLIAELERVRAEHGDIVVKVADNSGAEEYGGDFEVEDLWIYDSKEWSWGVEPAYVRLDHR